MKSVIWDLDGTLIDSYPLIMESLKSIQKRYGYVMSDEDIYEHIKKKSSKSLLTYLSQEYGVSYKELKDNYDIYFCEYEKTIKVIDNAVEVLETLMENDVDHYMYTHKGSSTIKLLESLKLKKYFKEIITGDDGFERKPNPEALNYLVEKHDLSKNQTYYVGDRKIDIECAKNVGIKSIFFNVDNYSEIESDYTVIDLNEVCTILK